MSNYIGKDFVQFGCGLILDKNEAWGAIDRSCRKNVKKSERAGIVVKRVNGTAEELESLRQIWYYPEDPNYPSQLPEGALMYMAFWGEELVGGAILLVVDDHLFLNNLTANKTGKKYQVQDYILWCIVEDLTDSEYVYLDVGVSYRYNLYKFFKKWGTITYPVIFNPPESKYIIKFKPTPKVSVFDAEPFCGDEQINTFFGTEHFTIVPDVSYALDIINDLKLDAEVVDLTRLMCLPFGAVILGYEVSPEVLWDNYGCYDHYKTFFIKKFIKTIIEHEKITTLSSLKQMIDYRYDSYKTIFSMENVIIDNSILETEYMVRMQVPEEFYDRFLDKLRRFEVDVLEESEVIPDADGKWLWLPAHPYLRWEDVIYIYAIYRGVLNICSAWQPTGVKGTLKV